MDVTKRREQKPRIKILRPDKIECVRNCYGRKKPVEAAAYIKSTRKTKHGLIPRILRKSTNSVDSKNMNGNVTNWDGPKNEAKRGHMLVGIISLRQLYSTLSS